MDTKYISKKRAKLLEENISFLSNYETPEDEIHIVGNSLEKKDEELTNALLELGKINIRRKELINKFNL